MRSVCRALHYHHYRHHHHHLNYQEAAQWVQHIQLYIFLIVTIIIQITKKRHNEVSMTSLTGSVESCVAVEVNLRVLFVCSLGAVHKWSHPFWGVSRPPPLPLVIMSSFGYPHPSFVSVNGEKNWSATKQRTSGRWWMFFQFSYSFFV